MLYGNCAQVPSFSFTLEPRHQHHRMSLRATTLSFIILNMIVSEIDHIFYIAIYLHTYLSNRLNFHKPVLGVLALYLPEHKFNFVKISKGYFALNKHILRRMIEEEPYLSFSTKAELNRITKKSSCLPFFKKAQLLYQRFPKYKKKKLMALLSLL